MADHRHPGPADGAPDRNRSDGPARGHARGRAVSGETWQRREGVKWDRASRYLRILAQLKTPGGITAAEIANRIGVSKRTVFRDLQAMSDEMQAGLPIWQEGGRWGIDESAFL